MDLPHAVACICDGGLQTEQARPREYSLGSNRNTFIRLPTIHLHGEGLFLNRNNLKKTFPPMQNILIYSVSNPNVFIGLQN